MQVALYAYEKIEINLGKRWIKNRRKQPVVVAYKMQYVAV